MNIKQRFILTICQQYKMAFSVKEIINLASIIASTVILILLLFFRSQFSWIKIFMLLCLMFAFMYVLVKNSKKHQRHQESLYGRPSRMSSMEKEPTVLDELTCFFENITANASNYSSRNLWKMERNYSQEIDSNLKASSSSRYTTTKSSLSEYEEKQLRRREFNILLPQNISEMVEEIRINIQPHNYFQLFNNQFQRVQLNRSKGNASTSKIYSEDLAPCETYCFEGKNSKFMLASNQELLINDPVYSVDIVADFLKDKVDALTRNNHYSFKIVSEIMMKCFGLTVNFGLKHRMTNTDSNEVTIQEVNDYLVRYRRQTPTYQNFKLIIPSNEFISSYLQRLMRASNSILKLLQHNDNPQVMTMSMYINILKETFPSEDVQMIVDRSVFSQDMKNVKHAFYVHQNAKRVFFTYNKIKNFMTKNPLLAVLAFFTEICKSGKYEREDVVRNLYKGFTENCKLA